MHIIDRSIAIIKPKQPYVDWANQLPDANSEVSLDDFQRDCFALLIAEYDTEEEAREHINEMWEDLFEEKLLGWSTNEDWWPEERTKEMFWEWFDVEFHSMVIDPYEDPFLDAVYIAAHHRHNRALYDVSPAGPLDRLCKKRSCDSNCR